MKQWIRIAWRNISRQRKRTILLAGAIGFALFVITLVNSFTGGLIVGIRQNFTQSFGGHIYVTGSVVEESGRETGVMRDADQLLGAIETSGIEVESVNYRSGTIGSLIYTTNEVFQLLDGVDFATATEFREAIRLVEGSWEELAQPGSILLPTSVTNQLDVALGEEILLSVSTVTGQRNVVELTLRGISAEVAGLGITSGYVRLDDLNAALGLTTDEFQTANLYLADNIDIDQATAALVAALEQTAVVERETLESEDGEDQVGPPTAILTRFIGVGGADIAEDERWEGTKFTITNLNELTTQFETVVATLNAIAFGIFAVLLVITAVGITNSYRMVMIERTQEIGTMRSIGVPQRGVRRVFTLESLFVAALGSIAGLALALLAVWIIGSVEWDAGTALSALLVRGRLQADVRLIPIIQNVVVILIVTVWAVRSPAKAAAELDPAQALRTTY